MHGINESKGTNEQLPLLPGYLGPSTNDTVYHPTVPLSCCPAVPAAAPGLRLNICSCFMAQKNPHIVWLFQFTSFRWWVTLSSFSECVIVSCIFSFRLSGVTWMWPWALPGDCHGVAGASQCLEGPRGLLATDREWFLGKHHDPTRP